MHLVFTPHADEKQIQIDTVCYRLGVQQRPIAKGSIMAGHRMCQVGEINTLIQVVIIRVTSKFRAKPYERCTSRGPAMQNCCLQIHVISYHLLFWTRLSADLILSL